LETFGWAPKKVRLILEKANKIVLMTDFVTEHQSDPGGGLGVFHVNETGYFARGTGRFRHAWGRFNLQGPFGRVSHCRPQSNPA